MKISYRREMKHNYLIIDPEELTWRNYECRMLSGNAIEGILQFQMRQIDDEIRFYYEITSRQPLSRMLEGRAIREPEIRRIILGISCILDRMEQYLLRENCALLEPDHIYVEPENFQIWLCLVPGLERDFPYDYGKLLEYLLGKIDHQDKESVILAYGLYQETRKENYGMEDILRLLLPGGEKQKAEEEMRREEGGDETEKIRQGAEQEQQWETQKGMLRESQQDTRQGRKSEAKKKTGLRAKIKKRWTDWRNKQKPSAYHQKGVSWEPLFCNDLQTEPGLSDFTKKSSLAQTERFHDDKMDGETTPFWDKTPAQGIGRNTALLVDLSLETNQNERKLCALDSGLEDIIISYYPFIIGKQEHLVDFYLNHETVSRLHVRIDQKGDGWTIQDLNSTNGTMVVGKMLENNESAPLCLGDEVKIAGLRYRFV